MDGTQNKGDGDKKKRKNKKEKKIFAMRRRKQTKVTKGVNWSRGADASKLQAGCQYRS